MADRPWCCPEPRCEPLHLLAEDLAPGESDCDEAEAVALAYLALDATHDQEGS